MSEHSEKGQTFDHIILVVDDSPANLIVLTDYLENSGFSTLVANSGEDALQQAVQHHPDLILLDVIMPDLDGFETCRRLKSQRVCPGHYHSGDELDHTRIS